MSDKPIPERWRNVSCAYYDDRVNDQMVTQLKEELGAAEAALSEARNDIAHIEMDRDIARQDRDTWRRVAERLEREKLAMADECDAFKSHIEYMEKVAVLLEAQVAQLQTTISTQEKQVSGLCHTITDMQTTISQLRKALESIHVIELERPGDCTILRMVDAALAVHAEEKP